jgi:8-oxo-dGTP pyrophosphatase MutT (NUDIX family)
MTRLLPDPGWLQQLAARLNQAPARPRAALELRWPGMAHGAACIGSIEPALAVRMADAGLPLHASGDAWRVETSTEAGIDPALAEIARWLHAMQLASAWRDERLYVADAAGKVLGCIERAAVRPLGIATHAVHLVAVDAVGRVWVQQRAFDKATDPGLWDTTMGGLVSAGESITQTLARETREEAGLDIDALHGVTPLKRSITVRRPVSEGYMVEHIAVFEAVAAPGQVPLNQDGEVERFECLDAPDLIERLHAGDFTLEAAMILAKWLERRAIEGKA